jgi:hypothetical protein
MLKRNRVFLIVIITLISVATDMLGQGYTFSPYSRYGMGDIEHRGFGRNTAMGGTGIALRSNEHLNDLNPASYSAMDSSSFFFETGLKGFYQDLSTIDNNASFSDINFEFFAIGFPIARWGAATIGIRPASGTGYNFANTSEDEKLGSISQEAYGTGSITRAYAGFSVNPLKFLSVGFHFSYLFGNLTSINSINYLNHPSALSYGRRQNIHVNDVFFDFGLQAAIPINEKSSITLGATFSPKTPLKGYSEELVARGTKVEIEGELFVDSDTLLYNKRDFSDNALKLPLSYGFGVAYNIKNKLTVSADYLTNGWDDISFPDEFSKTTTRTRYALGVEYIPNDRNPKSYVSRVRYRLGAHKLNDYLVINNYQLEDFGISFGAGFPLKRSKTSLNVAFEFGQRGTTDYGLVKEKYFNVYLNITLHEFWFMKQKFE